MEVGLKDRQQSQHHQRPMLVGKGLGASRISLLVVIRLIRTAGLCPAWTPGFPATASSTRTSIGTPSANYAPKKKLQTGPGALKHRGESDN